MKKEGRREKKEQKKAIKGWGRTRIRTTRDEHGYHRIIFIKCPPDLTSKRAHVSHHCGLLEEVK